MDLRAEHIRGRETFLKFGRRERLFQMFRACVLFNMQLLMLFYISIRLLLLSLLLLSREVV